MSKYCPNCVTEMKPETRTHATPVHKRRSKKVRRKCMVCPECGYVEDLASSSYYDYVEGQAKSAMKERDKKTEK